jgi:hypothetical protein
MGEGEGGEGEGGGITFTNKYRNKPMPKQLQLLFAITTILFAYACQPLSNEQKYTLKEWDSISAVKSAYEFDSLLTAKKYEGVRITDREEAHLISKTLHPNYDSLIIEYWAIPSHCSSTCFLYARNRKTKHLLYLTDREFTNYNPFFETEINALLKDIKLGEAEKGVGFLQTIMYNYFNAQLIDINDTVNVKNTAADYIKPVKTIHSDLCINSVLDNCEIVIKELKANQENTLIFNNFLFYYIINYEYKNGHLSIKYKEIIPSKYCALFLCL